MKNTISEIPAKGKIAIYQTKDKKIQLEVKLEQETVWLLQEQIKFYNLDVIISVGYRVNSSRATQFRIWATNVLEAVSLSGLTGQSRSIRYLDSPLPRRMTNY